MIYIGLAHFYIPKILCIFSILINTFFITLAYRKSSLSIGKYKYLLITFSLVNLFTTILETIAQLSTESFQFSCIVFVSDSLIYKYRDLVQFLLALRCSMVAYTYGVISVHFLYRYFAICQTHLTISFFKPQNILVIVCSVVLYGSTPVFIIAIWMWPDQETRLKLNHNFLEKYIETTENIPFLIADYQQTELTKNGLIGMGLATIVSISSIVFDGVLATKIHFAIKTWNMSDNLKKLHRTMLITLIAQTSIPSILTFFPCAISWFYPFFNLDLSYVSNSILMPMISAYPVIDPIVITFALTDYREAVFKIFGRKTKRISDNLATVLETTQL
ncbi:unnamed protein product [Caenorhabditis angaria]|uniref:G-protein coupled receptors family 1 profile domain-containing protein n=1 Tax=Caenorhabditis angaria TaxID=860376 RepID=A0A9P1IV05_9PELO|nr:unnamed protein product [Caenorhabditis angaria]